jgi:hypothetical protein
VSTARLHYSVVVSVVGVRGTLRSAETRATVDERG